MESALYYTFSTIPQTLAAIFALLGAFVLYRLQSLNTEIEKESTSLRNISADDDISTMHLMGEYDKVFKNMRDTCLLNRSDTFYFELHHKKLGHLLNLKKSLLLSLNISLYTTVPLILFSVIVLPFAPVTNKSAWLGILSFLIGIPWFVICLVCFTKLVRNALKF